MSDSPPPKVPSHPFAIGIRGVHHSQISQINQRAVLTLVGTNPGITNAEISRRCGLGAQTVSRFLLDLEQKGLIRRGSVLRGHPGQPATPYFLVYDSASAIGVEIGWRWLDLVLTDMSGEVRHARRLEHAGLPAVSVADAARRLCADLLAGLSVSERQTIVGLAFAVADRSCRGAEIARALAAASGLQPIRVDSGNVAAWAEHVGPESRWDGSLLYVHLDTFITSGSVIDGVLWRGGQGAGARLGMMRCGDASLDEVASLDALDRRLERAGRECLPAGPDYWLWQRDVPEGEAWLDAAGVALAEAIVNAEAMLGFRHALIGGRLPAAIAERLVQRILDIWQPQIDRGADLPNIEVGRIGPSAPAIGASYRVIHENLFSREILDVAAMRPPPPRRRQLHN